jgi:predicted transcriptional regulator
MVLNGAGMTQEDIALYLGCDVKTLRKHFSRQLQAGRVQLEGVALQVLYKRATEGSVTAAARLYEIARVRPATAPKLGKKELAKLDAGKPPVDVNDLIERTQRLH